MEKKQAIILLILILAVSLISFSLGVMVGRGGGDKPAIKAVPQAIPPRPTALASELQKPASENVPGQLLVAPQSDNAAETMAAPDKPVDNLTFTKPYRGEINRWGAGLICLQLLPTRVTKLPPRTGIWLRKVNRPPRGRPKRP
jgi:hypothetical protein